MKKLIPLFAIGIALLFTACSGESKKDTELQTEAESASEAQAKSQPEGRVIDVYGINQMKFVVKEKEEGLQVADQTYEINGETYYLLEGITAGTGEQLTVRLTTISNLPPSAMSHNWVLLEQETEVKSFINASAKARANDFIAPEMKDQVLQNTGLAGGGETVSVSFSAPEQTGDYEYVCSFPGHFAAGMRGTLTVK